jgi:hypothetical protein
MKADKIGPRLRFDGLAEAERVTGTSYKESRGTQLLGMALHIAGNERKSAALRAAGDSCFGTTIEEYHQIIKRLGFLQVLNIPFTCRENTEAFQIWWHDTDAILLAFDTYGGKSVNGGKFYYNVKLPFASCEIRSSGHFLEFDEKAKEGIWSGDHDCREAIRYHVERLREEGDFVNPWKERPFIWLLHHGDTKVEGYDYKAINSERIAMLPENVRTAITPRTIE